MIKRTLCFSHPAYLSLRNKQLVVKLEPHDNEPEKQATIPIEDIGIVVLDHRQITDKQFSDIELYIYKKEVEPNAPGQQLELF